MEGLQVKTGFVVVQLKDLAALADLICIMDNREVNPSIEQIGACHGLIIKMMGDHADDFYQADDGSETERLVA